MSDSLARDRQEDFEFWLADMDDALAGFRESIPSSIRAELDFSPESLDALEAWLLETYASADELLKSESSRAVDGLARYVGETFRKAIGGKWEIRVDDPKYVYYGLPQLTGYSERPTPIAPHTLVTACAERRTGRYWRMILESTRRRLGK